MSIVFISICTVKQIAYNEIFLLIKYVKSVLWSVAKCLSYIQDARCLKVNGQDCLFKSTRHNNDKVNKECAFTDIPITLTHSLQTIVTDKPSKCQEMAFGITQQWQLNKIIVIPLRLSAMGVNPNTLNLSLTNLNVPPRQPSQVQKMVVLNICSIVRQFHSDEVNNCPMKRVITYNHVNVPLCSALYSHFSSSKSKAIPLQAWTGPEGSRKLTFSDFKTIGT